MMVASTPDTVSPVADQAEALQIPCVSNDCPWQPYFFGRGGDPAVGFTWTYHAFWGLEDVTAVFTGMWDQLKTNKKVGAMWPNDADGLGWADPKTGQPPMLKAAGYTVVDGGRFQDGTEDYTPQISKFKAAGCDILSGVFIPPDFVNFWKQSLPAGLQADGRHRRQGAALPGRDGSHRRHRLRPHHRGAGGPRGIRSSRRSPARPARSSPTPGRAGTGKEWNQTLLHYAVFEIVVDALKRTTNVDDKQTILDAIKATDMETIQGHITWSAGAPLNPVPNVCRTVLVGRHVEQGHDVSVQHRRRQLRVGQDAAGRGHPDHSGIHGHRLLIQGSGAEARPDRPDGPGRASRRERREQRGAGLAASAPPHVSPVSTPTVAAAAPASAAGPRRTEERLAWADRIDEKESG